MLAEDPFLDRSRWQILLDQLAGFTFVPGATIGLLRKDAFLAKRGSLVLLQADVAGMCALVSAYSGTPGPAVGILLVVDEAAIEPMQRLGLASLRKLLHQGGLQPYILKTTDVLEAAGMTDFIEELGLAFPKH